jgi:hypothetical protein
VSLRIRNARAVSQGGARPGQYMGDPGIFGGIAGALKGAIKGGISGLTGGIIGGTVEERARMGRPTMGVPRRSSPDAGHCRNDAKAPAGWCHGFRSDGMPVGIPPEQVGVLPTGWHVRARW